MLRIDSFIDYEHEPNEVAANDEIDDFLDACQLEIDDTELASIIDASELEDI